MTGDIFIAVLSLLGTASGSLAGIIASNRTVNFRLQQSEERLDEVEHKAQEHAALSERITILEGRIQSASQQISEIKAELRRKA